MQVKICGITTYEDALASVEHGADMLGLNFYRKSPRYLEPDAALALCDRLRDELGADCPVLIGVFANEAVGTISVITNKVGLDAAQLSGDESLDMLRELRGVGFKAIRPPNKVLALDDAMYYGSAMPTREHIPELLLDAHHPKLYGGTGEQASDEIAIAVREQVSRLMLAGGLKPENVGQRVQAVQPWGVDVASGVEDDQPGIKNVDKVRDFIQAAKEAATE